MRSSICLLLIQIAFTSPYVDSLLQKDDPKALISLSDASKLRVTLTCETKFIKVQLTFNMTSFRDWIVIGNTQNERCRLQGNGDVTYVMQLPLMGDGCGTKMSDSGTFENTISIRSNPLLILQGDEVVAIKCAYGPPEIGSPLVPLLPTSPQPNYIDRATDTVTVASSPDVKLAGMPVGYIYLIVFLVLFLALLFLICGCLYFFLKRRKVRVERKKRLMLAVPHSSDLSKIHFGGLWWPGKNSPHHDTLLSQDYMVSTNSTREQLSVTTEYAGETPSTSSGDSPEAPHQGYRNKALVHDARHMIPRVHTDHMAIRNIPVINSLQSIPEENRLDADSLRKGGGTDSSSLHGPLYAPVDKSDKDLHSRHLSQLMSPKSDLIKSQITMISDIRSQMRSTTEIYSLPPDQLDSDSISTLEGHQYVSESRVPTSSQHVAVDVHSAPTPTESHYQCPIGSTASQTTAENSRISPIDQIDWQLYIQAVENNIGSGPKKLNQEDVDIWRHLVSNDRNLRSLIATAKSLEDFELISHHPQFSDLYSREKWAAIVQSLAHVAFMQRLSDIIDTKKPSEGGEPADNDLTSIVDKQRRANRIFTRESYYRVRDEMESMSSGDEMTLQLDYYSHLPPPIESVHSSTSQMSQTATEPQKSPPGKISPKPKLQLSTSKVSNSSNTFIRERSTSECFEHPPTLSVYVGNVADRNNPNLSSEDPYHSGANGYFMANSNNLGSFSSQLSQAERVHKPLEKF